MTSAEKIVDKSAEDVEDADEENVITLSEFIEEEQRLEKDADALLGPSDLKNCTYSKGYMKRQALYSCKTCTGDQPAGVCVACSYQCHEGHDLVELYTKRNFRCDCGNSKFGDKKCSLEPEKDTDNVANSYNQNFEGKYCTCSRPYPDPEDPVSDSMIQCSVCEDWFHTRHVTSNMPNEDQYGEMICTSCTERLQFLQNYSGFAVTVVAKENGTAETDVKEEVKEEVKTEVVEKEPLVNGAKEEANCKLDCPVLVKDESVDVIACDNKDSINVKEADNTQKGCILENTKPIPWEKKEATFWPNNFRSLLCSCPSCKDMYLKLGVQWLVDDTDTVSWYEANGRGEAGSAGDSKPANMDQVMSMMDKAGMDRFSQAEAILNYNEMKTHLMQYLSKFAENKKVVREEHIYEFFQQMKAKKRQKLSQTTYTCR